MVWNWETLRKSTFKCCSKQGCHSSVPTISAKCLDFRSSSGNGRSQVWGTECEWRSNVADFLPAWRRLPDLCKRTVLWSCGGEWGLCRGSELNGRWEGGAVHRSLRGWGCEWAGMISISRGVHSDGIGLGKMRNWVEIPEPGPPGPVPVPPVPAGPTSLGMPAWWKFISIDTFQLLPSKKNSKLFVLSLPLLRIEFKGKNNP
jgi:hypothetical protein